ncbi:oxidoreductase [Iodidimonas gelatinilytica]|uniref:Oxidoreductase n=1 Tax=Iodidimonas gelatinilytica TaxID=1236966 RepID=A0A5A7MWU1_9PROT|nr:nitroreductase family protein [Iodidimonas gelatinilytica]GEQ99379.1 oxidoreductase [Iodidimonas gelatinilytica]
MKAPYIEYPLTGYPHRSDAQMIDSARAFRILMEKRRTIRFFKPDPIPQSVIEDAVKTAATAPSGANKQPWHFVIVTDPDLKTKIRAAAEEEERAFYGGKAGQEWLDDLAHLGTDAHKPFLEIAPCLIVCFQQNYQIDEESGKRSKSYYVQESMGIACGFLLAALHNAGLATLTHTPSPMGFLRDILGRPKNERAVMLVVTGRPADDATVPKLTKKPFDQVASLKA